MNSTRRSTYSYYQRPEDQPWGPGDKPKSKRHDEATSKTLIWADQANAATVNQNQDLRKRYLESYGKGMTQEEIDRAKILVTRDERKRKRKKAEKKNEILPEDTANNGTRKKERKVNKSNTPSSKSQRDKNKSLRKLYHKTGGKGMKENQIERAKQLLERDERKKKRRAEIVIS
jgi:hypothetical protein